MTTPPYVEEHLPSLEAPPPNAQCPRCGAYLELVDFCGECYERADDRRDEE